MAKSKILITGVMGEVGQSLVNFFCEEDKYDIVALDTKRGDESILRKCSRFYQGDVLDQQLIAEIEAGHTFDMVYHLAAILSTEGEKDPLRTHHVNVHGSINMLELARRQSEKSANPVIFIFPSTISIYGIRNLEEKCYAGMVNERQYLNPITMYGVNKLYVEKIGQYYDSYFKLLRDNNTGPKVDFRCVRFPGIISSETMPTGGTSDYASEMIHAAAQGRLYECFVRPDTRIPFIVMPDAVRCLIELSRVPSDSLLHNVYNVAAFSPSAEEIHQEILEYIPNAEIRYKPHAQRQKIVDSWPGYIDDTSARQDWGWKSAHDLDRAFRHYLIPGIAASYSYPENGFSTSQCVNW